MHKGLPPPPRKGPCSRATTSLFMDWRTWEGNCTLKDMPTLRVLPRCSPWPNMALCPAPWPSWQPQTAFRVFLKGLMTSRHRDPLVVWLPGGVLGSTSCLNLCLSQVEPRHTMSRTIIVEPEFKRQRFSEGLPHHGKAPQGGFQSRAAPDENGWWDWTVPSLSIPPHPAPPCHAPAPALCHSGNSVLGRAPASEPGSLKTGILTPTLGS